MELAAARTLGDAARAAAAKFRAAGLDTPDLDARLLAAHAAGIDQRSDPLWRERGLDETARAKLEEFARRRLAREPVSRITGKRGFWTLELAVAPDVLDPRPDTETLVEAALGSIPDRASKLRILDLGTGSGAILLALLSELPGSEGIGLDISDAALAAAEANAAALGLAARARFLKGDFASLAAEVLGQSALVVSNPPYSPADDISGLEPEARDFDPALALNGGADGLFAFRAIFAAAPPVLARNGLILVEFGAGQAASVEAIAGNAGFGSIRIYRDLAGRERVLSARLL